MLTGLDGKLIEDIDTDQIFHNQHLHITQSQEMGRFAFGNLAGWEDFSQKSSPGDILFAGRNFGAGSSRQQAVDCFLALEIKAILAVSFGAIYFRNAVNSGLPVLQCPASAELMARGEVKTGDEIRLDYLQGEGRIAARNVSFEFHPMSRVQHEIFISGGLFQFGKTSE